MMRDTFNYRSGLQVLCIVSCGFRSVLCQCSGTALMFIATDDYQVFTSLNYPFGYGNDQKCTWHIDADNVTDAVRLEITDTSIEYHAICVYDHGEVYDGFNASARSLGKFCGTSTPDYVSTGSNMTVTFTSDYSLYSKGFKARYKSGPRSTLVDNEPEEDHFGLLAILGISIGCVVFVLVALALVYTYIQAKKAKEMRRGPRMREGLSSTRVEQFAYGGWSFLDGPAPPAYGEIYSSPLSPPPDYCEMDPNPSPTAQLPGRTEVMENQRSATNYSSQHSGQRGDTNANTHFVIANSALRFPGELSVAQLQQNQVSYVNTLQTQNSVDSQNSTTSRTVVVSATNNVQTIQMSLPNSTESVDVSTLGVGRDLIHEEQTPQQAEQLQQDVERSL